MKLARQNSQENIPRVFSLSANLHLEGMKTLLGVKGRKYISHETSETSAEKKSKLFIWKISKRNFFPTPYFQRYCSKIYFQPSTTRNLLIPSRLADKKKREIFS